MIARLKQIVDDSPTGHLPLKHRIELMKSINDPTIVNKIFLECVKKVYPIWKSEYPEQRLMADIQREINDYLYKGTRNKEGLIAMADQHRNYFVNQSEFVAIFGLAVFSLLYSIACDAASILEVEDYRGEDDGDFDYEYWNPDFLASMAYAKGNPFIGVGDIQKRKEFWLWYLETVNILIKSPSSFIIPLVSIDRSKGSLIMPTRSQKWDTSKNKKNIALVIEDLFDSLKEANLAIGENIRLNYHTVSGLMLQAYRINNNSFELLEDIYLGGGMILFDIKKEMYRQAENEGAWFQCSMDINPQGDYTITFNYDNIKLLPEAFQDADYLKDEFKKFPRAKEFTPKWWQDILDKKIKYLK